MRNNIVCVPKAESGTNARKLPHPDTGVFAHR